MRDWSSCAPGRSRRRSIERSGALAEQSRLQLRELLLKFGRLAGFERHHRKQILGTPVRFGGIEQQPRIGLSSGELCLVE